MKVVLKFSFLILAFSSCLKGTEPPPKPSYTCDCPDQSIKVDSSSVFGCWLLTDTSYYSQIITNPWIPINRVPAVIKFNPDSSFCYDSNFTWSYARYNYFTSEGAFIFLESTYAGQHPVSAQLTGNNELILSFIYIDAGPEERYRRK
jgi:hypothetical protein